MPGKQPLMRFSCAFIALSASLYAQAMRGLYTNVKISGAESENNRTAAALEANRHLNGILVSASWQDLEPASEQYDFSALDRVLAVVRRAGGNTFC